MQGKTNTDTVMTAQDVAEKIFGGNKSAWAILSDARKGRIPHFKIGKKVYFSEAAIMNYIQSLSAVTVVQPNSNSSGNIKLIR